ncbi:MAG: hypothetical protein MH204_06120 [Fimbriimonadaceae bacterium]|nr:hypothetical protein [Fimbriimonadaceae bacterium]
MANRRCISPEEFWKWFEGRRGLSRVLPAIWTMKSCMRQLDGFADKLAVEIQVVPGEKHRILIISADGIGENIPVVEQIVAAAPRMVEWQVVAFRPAIDADQLQIFGQNFQTDSMRMVTQWVDGKLDVWLFFGDEERHRKEEMIAPGFLALDHLVGEYLVMTKLEHVEFLPAVRAPANAGPIWALPAILDAGPPG